MTLAAHLPPLARRLFERLSGRDLVFRPDVQVATEFHGTEYGGWAILRDSLGPDARVISAGVGEDASFDLALIRKYGCAVHALDPTPKAVHWAQQHVRDPRFVLHQLALSDADGSLRLYFPARDDHVSASFRPGGHLSRRVFDAPARTLQTLFALFGMESVDVLKMDIEGAEYGVIENGLGTGAFERVGQLLVEFHHHLSSFSPAATCHSVDALRSAGWRIAWVSPSHHEMLFVPEHRVRELTSLGSGA
jgi:FkbM family methyltransferase